MKGLLLKDFYMMRKYCRSFLLVCAVFLAASFFNGDNTFFLLYISVFTSMLPVTLLSYDERFKWDQYADTFPVSRAQTVTEKYLIALICGGTGAVLCSLAVAAVSAKTGITAAEFISEVSIFWTISLSAPALLLPVIYKFGVERGRIVYYIVIGAGCALSTILSNSINSDTGLVLRGSSLIIVLAAIVLFVFSWRLSVRIYSKRQL